MFFKDSWLSNCSFEQFDSTVYFCLALAEAL